MENTTNTYTLGTVENEHIDLETESSDIIKNNNTTSMEKYTPEFKPTEKTKPSIIHCKTCGVECTNTNIEGECTTCALKRLRTLETRLAHLHKIKQEHVFCPVSGHGEAYKNKLHPEWEGKFIINGVELYPVYPLCKTCLDALTAYFIYFLEERGILRKGNNHTESKWGEPYKVPLTIGQKESALHKLEEFISVVNLYVRDQSHPLNTVYNSIKKRYSILLENEMKEVKEWEEKRKVKLPQNQLEVLQLIEKHSPLLQKYSTKEKQEKDELEFLKTQKIPEVLLKLLEKELLKKLVEQLQKKKLLEKLKNLPDPEKQKLSRQLLIDSLGNEVLQILLDLETEIKNLLGIQFVNSAEEVLNEILERYTLSNLMSNSMTNE